MKKKVVFLIIMLAIINTFLLIGCGKASYTETQSSSDVITETETDVTIEAVTEKFEVRETEATEIITGEIMPETEKGISDISLMPAGTVISEEDIAAYGEENCFYVEEISEELFARINGLTFKEYSPVTLDEIRYIRCLHRNAEGDILIGELIMNAALADEICDIFYELYKAGYPIEKMLLADEYDADDLESAGDNNTSGFNVRYVEFSTNLSLHAYGLAIDINPLYNPYYITNQNLALPENGYEYIEHRDSEFPYKIEEGDLCHHLFTEKGYTWGGVWGWPDYMHFEKRLS